MTKKHRELSASVHMLHAFVQAQNRVTLQGLKPSIQIDETVSYFGYYPIDKKDWSTLFINLKKCELSRPRNRPGYILDHTIVGVAAHEFGHMLHIRGYGMGKGFLYPILNKRFKLLRRESLIHYREMNIEEDIAEAIRLFILNPRLLERGRPMRFAILSEYLNEIDASEHLEIGSSNKADFFTECWIAGTN